MTNDKHIQPYFHASDQFPYRPISPVWLTIYTLPSFCFFLIVSRYVAVSSKNNARGNSTWAQRNTIISFIHSFISSILLVIAVIRAPEMLDDPMSHANRFNYALAAFSLGYFLWDFVDCRQNSTLSTLGILIHHIASISFLGYILFYTRNLGYALYGLSFEINSVFLHARRLLRWYAPTSLSNNSRELFRIFITIGNYLTFIIFRFVVMGAGFLALYFQRYRLNPVVHACITLASIAVGFLNIILFYRLIKNDFSSSSKSKRDKLKDDLPEKSIDEMLAPI